jgi:hypothetical protein
MFLSILVLVMYFSDQTYFFLLAFNIRLVNIYSEYDLIIIIYTLKHDPCSKSSSHIKICRFHSCIYVLYRCSMQTLSTQNKIILLLWEYTCYIFCLFPSSPINSNLKATEISMVYTKEYDMCSMPLRGRMRDGNAHNRATYHQWERIRTSSQL